MNQGNRTTPPDRAWTEFVNHVREDAVKKIDSSAVMISIVPDPDALDIKYAVELGLGIMLDKPLVLLVTPGRPVPDRLRRVADRIVEADLDVEEGREALQSALVEMGLIER